MTQNSLSVVTHIKAGQVEFPRNAARNHRRRHSGQYPRPLSAVPDAAFCLLGRAETRSRTSRRAWCWKATSTATWMTHVNEYLQCAAGGPERHLQPLRRLSRPKPLPTRSKLKQYLMAHRVADAAFYVGCYGQSLGVIRSSLATRESIETFLDQEQPKRTLCRPVADSDLQPHQGVPERASRRDPRTRPPRRTARS